MQPGLFRELGVDRLYFCKMETAEEDALCWQPPAEHLCRPQQLECWEQGDMLCGAGMGRVSSKVRQNLAAQKGLRLLLCRRCTASRGCEQKREVIQFTFQLGLLAFQTEEWTIKSSPSPPQDLRLFTSAVCSSPRHQHLEYSVHSHPPPFVFRYWF